MTATPSKLRHYVLNMPVHSHDIINHMYNIEVQVAAKIVDMAEEATVQAVIDEAGRAGITDLYLLDKKFVTEALREKLERECEKRD